MTALTLHGVDLGEHGPGVPLVFAHALGLDHRMWAPLAQSLANSHPVLMPDQRGHGQSPRAEAAFTLDDLVDDAVALIEGWGRGPVVWVGLSMGGMVGQGLALRRPDLLKGLVLAHTTAQYPPAGREAWATRMAAVQSGGMAAVADLVLQRYLHDDYRAAHPDVADDLRRTVLANDPASYVATCAAIAAVDYLEALHTLRLPTLVIAGERDLGAPPAMSRAIADRIPGATLVVLPGASHLGPIESPEAFAAPLRAWLSTLDRPGRVA